MDRMLDKPVWIERASRTLTVCLRTNGCSYAKSTFFKGCLHCELIRLSCNLVSSGNLVNQLKHALDNNDKKIDTLNLLVLGSFLDPNEISDSTKEKIGRLLEGTSIKSIMLESRPQFITIHSLRRLKNIFKGLNIEIAIGIETVNDDVRLNYLHKGYGINDIEMAISYLAKANMAVAGYVLLKPPIFSEEQAINDVIKTSKYIFSFKEIYGIPSRVLLQPYYVPMSNKVNDCHLHKYRPPYLWSIIEVLRQVDDLGDIFVGLNNEQLASDQTRNCPKCTNMVLDLIRQYNSTGNIEIFDGTSCYCQSNWWSEMYKNCFEHTESLLC